MSKSAWTLTNARARLSEVIERAATEGPQTVTRNGRTAAIVVAPRDWERRTKRKGSLVEFFANSPLRGSGLKITRSKDAPRKSRSVSARQLPT